MVLAVTGQASQGGLIAAATSKAANAFATQGAALVAGNFQAAAGRASQGAVLVAAKGRINDPVVRCWTYTLDGHDFYVLRCGNIETLVYDTMSKEWSVYGSDDTDLWKAFQGWNWIGAGQLPDQYGSNVVVGDDATGALYFLNPFGDVDSDPVDTTVTRPFTRILQTQTPVRGYDSYPCYGIELQGSIGEYSDTVNLAVSDDRGTTYNSVGTLNTVAGDYSTRLNWRSLGKIKAPGRLFKITDYGALRRIDSITMKDGQDG